MYICIFNYIHDFMFIVIAIMCVERPLPFASRHTRSACLSMSVICCGIATWTSAIC